MSETQKMHMKELLGEDQTQLFINQLLLAMVISQGCTVEVPMADVDATGGYILEMEIDKPRGVFILRAKKKQ